jgi:hypothetical protein
VRRQKKVNADAAPSAWPWIENARESALMDWGKMA